MTSKVSPLKFFGNILIKIMLMKFLKILWFLVYELCWRRALLYKYRCCFLFIYIIRFTLLIYFSTLFPHLLKSTECFKVTWLTLKIIIFFLHLLLKFSQVPSSFVHEIPVRATNWENLYIDNLNQNTSVPYMLISTSIH